MDHVYTNIAGAYMATPLPHLGQSDHLSLFLTPKYTPLIDRVKPSVKTIKVWPVGADSVLQDRFKDRLEKVCLSGYLWLSHKH